MLVSPLPKSLLLRLARGPLAVKAGPIAAGKAPEAEEERERFVRGLGCLLAVVPLLTALE